MCCFPFCNGFYIRLVVGEAGWYGGTFQLSTFCSFFFWFPPHSPLRTFSAVEKIVLGISLHILLFIDCPQPLHFNAKQTAS